MLLRRLRLAELALFAFCLPVWAGSVDSVHIRNFGKVNEHLYRGGEPTEDGMKELAGIHVVMDIDLREPGPATDTERHAAERLGMKYVSVPLPAFSAPSPGDVKRVLSLILPDDNGRVFVHCRRGKDRTGTIIACYRMQHDGWTTAEALGEANRYGMSSMERGMRHFILSFKPFDVSPANP
jgi:tyrosine-protein phosphatase SIW14